jgi:gluconolactonase
MKNQMQKLNQIIEPGDPELISSGYQFTEGPVWMPGEGLLFSDIPANTIFQWSQEMGSKPWREDSGNSNGLTLDRKDHLLACEHGHRRVSITDSEGEVSTLADQFQGKRLNSPNDIVVRSDGLVYFTDPPYGVEPAEKEQPINGVYCIRSKEEIDLIADDFERPNGLAFSPDEKLLYIADSPRRHVRAFDVRPDGSLENSRIFADMNHPQPGSPDGMKVNEEGHLFVAGATGVWVFEPDGEWLGVIGFPERPSNCAWGDQDHRTLYITARTSVYRFRSRIPGVVSGTG